MKIEFTHWIESDGTHLGFLNEYPDHWTQGETLEDLKDHLLDLHEIFSEEPIPGIRHVSVLELTG
jgi:predicted RNase H-like HicB family nuclease